ncbi:MAG TPA: indolepyruvate oxidoreductase subunit beta [Clostridiales bacterium]|nr:indolepyruvate oxidoreductase subunit beta [Clostridiales bacterium]
MNDTKAIMIVGVGGQGTLLASRILGNVLLFQGYDVKVSEVHGMSQRGGSVVTYVKFGKKVYSPIIDRGEADYILSFERLEAARWLPYLKEGGKIIVNDQRISPMPVITGAMGYPQDILAKIKSTGANLITVDALSLAEEAGNSKSVNVVLMGLLSSMMDIPTQAWQEVLEATIKPKFLDVNKKAFELGRSAANAV